ncbi:MAG: phosphotransferase [SAR324 cluster bacterium]|nr:phosphotransferase [SAR324 cluster bacterium]
MAPHHQALTELAAQALPQWGLPPQTPQLLKFRENAVFRVRRADGQPAVLRIHRLGYHSDAALRSELAWMALLNEHGIATPQPLPSVEGGFFIHLASEQLPEPRQLDLLSWLDGTPLGQSRVPLTLTGRTRTDTFRRIGETLARMHALTQSWTLPDGFERHAWDFEGLLGEAPLWGRFWKSPHLSGRDSEVINEALAEARDALATYERSTRNYGLIHADFVRENLLLSGNTVQVIDFDDSGFGWHLYDVAIALFQNRIEPDVGDLKAALVEGYRRNRSLTAADVAALPLFTLLRAFAVLGWISTRADSDTAREAGPAMAGRSVAMAQDFLAGNQA